MDRRVDPIEFEVVKNLFVSIAEEMGVALCRTAFSPNIKERRDYSCALYDAGGHTIAQADHIPVHLGAMPLSVRAAIDDIPLRQGDVAMLNDPYRGGTHLPDITLVAPVCLSRRGRPIFYVANRAHHADVGGMSPGSMPLARELYQEGLIIPPVALVRTGEVVADVMRLVLANVRTPQEREGDLTAQLAAIRIGERRLLDAVARHGPRRLARHAAAMQAYTERMMREAIAAIPDGAYDCEDTLEDDGFGHGPIPIRVRMTIDGDSAHLDFSGSSPQVEGGVNANYAITLSATLYAFRCLLTDEAPFNAGLSRPIRVHAPAGTVVNPSRPAAVAGGNVETSQRITDVVLGALAQALPGRIPAGSQGTMNNVTLGGVDPRTGARFAYYETLGGGMGGRPGRAGLSGVHTHMSNTRNTPVEAIEHAVPLRIREYALRRGSGGTGAFAGGDGLVREFEVLAPVEVNILSERRETGPRGAHGGRDGQPGRNLVLRRDGRVESLSGKARLWLDAGDRLRIETPGGGGYGVPPCSNGSGPVTG